MLRFTATTRSVSGRLTFPRSRFGYTASLSSTSGRDVLVDAKQVLRVVLCLDGPQAPVVVPVRRGDAPLDLVVHHEVDVCAFKVERVNRIPICAPPRLQGVSVFR